ncbi:MAG: hypothetical protein JO355_09955 [Planctomycetaceae bacterium]|nr:hypothetical protein [Planctomycetaceae bacterium]
MSFEAAVAAARTIKEADSYPLAKLREDPGTATASDRFGRGARDDKLATCGVA